MSTFAKYTLGEILKRIFIILIVFSFMAFTLNECSGLITPTPSLEPCLKKSVKSFNGEAYIRRLAQMNYSAGVKADGGNWTFMVYLDGDNNLEGDCIDIFLDLSSVGSTPNVTIVVQLDRISGEDDRFGDWTDCNRFYVTKDLIPTDGNATEHLGEVNMGDPNTLTNFVNWAIGSYPADKYCLVLSDHGTGCVHSVCVDYTDGYDWITLPELSQALSVVSQRMDVVYFDACLMGMVEVAYQIRDYADVMVASEEVAWTGTPYDQYLSNLTANPSMSAGELADVIVSSYIEYTNATSHTSTMSGVDLSQMSTLKTAVNDLAQRLNDSENTYNSEIRKARGQAEAYAGPYSDVAYGWYMDLYHFAQLIYQYIDDPTIRTDASQVMASVSSAVIVEGHYDHPNSHGLSIFFPCKTDSHYSTFMTAYSTTDFAKDTVWDAFIGYHVSITPQKPDLVVVDVYWEPSSPLMPGDSVTFYADVANEGTQDATSVVVRAYKDGLLYASGIFDFFAGASRAYKAVDTLSTSWTASLGKHNITWIMDPNNNFDEWNETNNEMTKTFVVGYSLTVQTPYSGITVKIDGSWYATKPDGSYQRYVSPGFHSVEVPASVPLASWTQGVFVQWNDGNSSNVRNIFVDNDLTMTAEYVTQYYLTVKKNPSYVGATITGQGWYNNGTIAVANCTSLVPGTTYRYVFVNWTGDAFGNSPTLYILMNSPKTVTANYKEQYNVTFTTYGCGGSPHIIVDSVTYSLPCSFWLDSGSSHAFSYESPVSGGAGVQYVLTSTSYNSPFTVTYGATITGYYKTQFYVTVNSAHGTPTSSQWVDKYSYLPVNVQSPTETTPNQTRWRCTGFSVDHATPQAGTSHTFWTILEPHEIEFYWKQQFWLQVNTGVSGSTVTGTGWYDNGTVASILANTPYTVSAGHRFVFVSWISTGTNIASITNATSPQTTVHMDNYYTVQANWKEQFYLTVKTNPMGLTQPIASPGGPWYNNGTSVTCTAQKTSGYGFDHWTVGGTSWDSGVNPIMVTMDAPHEVTAYYFTDNVKPSIGVPIHQPNPPNQGENVTVLVNVTDSGSRVGEVFLYYRTNSDEAWTEVNMTKLTGDTYVGKILGFEADTHVQYYVIAYDNAYNQAIQNKDGVYYDYIVIPEFQTFAFLLLFMSLSLITVVLTKKIRRKVIMNAKS
jgi:hypothetical protein